MKPTVMRRVEVPVWITLDTLHEIIQAIMPWENSHLHAFYLRLIDGPRWAPPSPFGDDFNFGIKARDSMRTTVAEALAEPNFKALRYNYDFGDDWRHTIKVERGFSADLREEFPKLIDAKGRCPPENCGGPWGYAEILDAISDPAIKRRSEFRRWLRDFGSKNIDRTAIKAALHQFTKAKPTAKTATRNSSGESDGLHAGRHRTGNALEGAGRLPIFAATGENACTGIASV